MRRCGVAAADDDEEAGRRLSLDDDDDEDDVDADDDDDDDDDVGWVDLSLRELLLRRLRSLSRRRPPPSALRGLS